MIFHLNIGQAALYQQVKFFKDHLFCLSVTFWKRKSLHHLIPNGPISVQWELISFLADIEYNRSLSCIIRRNNNLNLYILWLKINSFQVCMMWEDQNILIHLQVYEEFNWSGIDWLYQRIHRFDHQNSLLQILTCYFPFKLLN